MPSTKAPERFLTPEFYVLPGEDMGVVSEFKDFLKEYKVMGLAVAFIIGTALTSLTKSLVDNVIMPIIGVLLPNGNWQTATIGIGPVQVGWGAFTSALINFIIIAFVVFIMVKFIASPPKLDVAGLKKRIKR